MAVTPYQANRVLAIISAMYGWAASRPVALVPEGTNPTRGVERFSEKRRGDVLASDALARLCTTIRQAETEGLPWKLNPAGKVKHRARPEARVTKIGMLCDIGHLLAVTQTLERNGRAAWNPAAALGLPNAEKSSRRIPAMPFLLIVRFLFSLPSLAVLAGAAYLVWRWYAGYFVADADGLARHVREEWPLWTGLVMLAWSFLGGLVLRPLVTSPDTRPLKPVRPAGRTIQSPTGSKLAVQVHGVAGAPTIILTHGWSLDSSIWAYAIEDLSPRFRVITWDLPQMGKSRGRIDLSGFAEDLRAVIQFAGDKRTVLVGHSIGGMTIQTLARDDPTFVDGHVAGIVLLNTTYTNPLRTMILSPLWQVLRWPVLEPLMWLATPLQPLLWISAWQSYLSGTAHLANRIGFGKHVSRSQLDLATLLATKNPPGAQARGCLAMFRWDATGALRKIAVPVLIVGGEMDIITKPQASREIASSVVGESLTIVPDVNHMGFIERPEVYDELIARFADSLQRQKSRPLRGVPYEAGEGTT